MDPHKINWPDKSDQIDHSHKNYSSVSEKKELDYKYSLVLSESDQLKKRIHNFIHDLRNPLFGIAGLIDLIIIEDKDRVEVQTRDLIVIKEAAQSLLDLINASLVTEDAQINLIESTNGDRNLSSVITKINRLYLPMAQNKDISLWIRNQIDSEIQLPTNFFINMMRITGNLVANAIKFTPPKGSVNVVFTLNTDEKHTTLNMTVTDTGKSMSPDQVSAFNQGKSVPNTMGTNGEQGFGIGLKHVLQMVSEYSGSIIVKSEKDSGTTFSLSFFLSDKYLIRENSVHSIVKNGVGLRNGTKK